MTAAETAALRADDVLARLGSGTTGLREDEATRRLRVVGPNAVRSHRVRALLVLASQLRSPLLILLAATALASAFLGQVSDAVIIGIILLASVGLGFVNEYKAAKTAEALHSSVRHSCVALRDGHPRSLDVTELVPGDAVDLQLGQVVPADLRLLAVAGLECDESVLTGESLPAEKTPAPVAAGTPLAELGSCALMGTVVRAGSGTASWSPPAAQLLPAVVSTSLAAGSRQLARQKVLVKRLVCIEDLGNVDVLFTDKTGTLTVGTRSPRAPPRRPLHHRPHSLASPQAQLIEGDALNASAV